MLIRVLIAENDTAARNELREMVGREPDCQVVALARDGQEAVQMAMQLSPHLAIIAHDLPGMSGIQTCEMLNALAPDIMTVYISDGKTQDKINAAMRAGVRALLTEPVTAQHLGPVILELAEIRQKRESPEVQEWKDPSRYPRIISVTGAKGGVGKSTIAVNLASLMAKRRPNKVALIDLYTQFGDAATMLGLNPKRTIADMAPLCHELDSDLVQSHITKHSTSGLHLLVASVKPISLDAISPECMDSLLYVLKRNYRYIVVDVPPMLNDITLHVLAHSSSVLLIANLFDLTTASDTKKLYDALQTEHVARENMRIVLNRVSKVNKLATVDVEQMFEGGIFAHIPNDPRLVASVNQGIPLVLHDGESAFGRSMSRLAGAVTGHREDMAALPAEIPKKSIFKSRRKG